MVNQVFPVLTSGALLIVVTMTMGFLWSGVSTVQQSRSRLLADMEPLFLWVEIQTINMRFANYSRGRALYIVFTGLGLLIWTLLAVMTLLMHVVSPDLLSFFLQL